MAGGSRAAQRRAKARKQPQPSSQSTATGRKSKPAAAAAAQRLSAFASDSDDDDDDAPVAAMPVPLPSLEQGSVRDFEAEQQAQHVRKPPTSKRARAEQAQLALDQRKKRYREDKATKIVWRKFDRENASFERFYEQFLQLSSDEWTRFLASLKQPVPVYVSVNGNYRSLSEVVTGTLETDFDVEDMAVKLASGEEVHVDFAPVKWAVDGQHSKTMWKLSMDSKSLRKCAPLRDLSKYVDAQLRLGTLLRQDPAAALLPAFLDVQPGQSVLDLGGGGEHRAPVLMELLRPSTTIESSTALVVNELDAAGAANAIRALARTLAASPEVVVTAQKPSEFPVPADAASRFDRVVCCAPCSRDGLVRQLPELWRTWRPSEALGFHASQLHVLTQALELVKVGGRVVYSTRSLNPVEDEAVVAEVLRRHLDNGALQLVDVADVCPDLHRVQGKAEWQVVDDEMKPVESWEAASDAQKKTLRPTMWSPSTAERKQMHLERCFRLLPHQNDTHGLFVAVIEKVREPVAPLPAGPAIPSSSTAATKASKKQRKAERKHLGSYAPMAGARWDQVQTFLGLPAEQHDWFLERSGVASDSKSVHFVTPGVVNLIDRVYAGRLSIHRAGVEALRPSTTAFGGSELTDDGARALLPSLSRRVLNLEMDEFSTLLSTKQMWLKQASEGVREALEAMSEGALVIALDDMEPAQTGDRDLVLVAHKRHNSYSLASTPAAIARVKALLAELNVGEEDDDGYDSFEFEED